MLCFLCGEYKEESPIHMLLRISEKIVLNELVFKNVECVSGCRTHRLIITTLHGAKRNK